MVPAPQHQPGLFTSPNTVTAPADVAAPGPQDLLGAAL